MSTMTTPFDPSRLMLQWCKVFGSAPTNVREALAGRAVVLRPDITGRAAVAALLDDLVWLDTNRPPNHPIDARHWRWLCMYAANGRGSPVDSLSVGRITEPTPLIPPDARTLGLTTPPHPVDCGTLSPSEPAPLSTAGNPPDDAPPPPEIAQTDQPPQPLQD